MIKLINAEMKPIIMETFKVGVVINEEKLSNGKTVFVAHCESLDVTTQGYTFEEALKNVKEAIDIEIEECPEKLERFIEMSSPVFTTIEVLRNVQAANPIRG
jgi:predicted RNase H-like HicB family nuclease